MKDILCFRMSSYKGIQPKFKYLQIDVQESDEILGSHESPWFNIRNIEYKEFDLQQEDSLDIIAQDFERYRMQYFHKPRYGLVYNNDGQEIEDDVLMQLAGKEISSLPNGDFIEKAKIAAMKSKIPIYQKNQFVQIYLESIEEWIFGKVVKADPGK